MATADYLQISLSEVSSTAASIRTSNNNIQSNLDSIKTQMNQLIDTWSSPAGENIRTRFNALDETFQNHYTKIDNYATFLDKTVDTYSTMEASLSSSADSFT